MLLRRQVGKVYIEYVYIVFGLLENTWCYLHESPHFQKACMAGRVGYLI